MEDGQKWATTGYDLVALEGGSGSTAYSGYSHRDSMEHEWSVDVGLFRRQEGATEIVLRKVIPNSVKIVTQIRVGAHPTTHKSPNVIAKIGKQPPKHRILTNKEP